MAIDRTKAYYKTWVNDVGWNMRFEIIPAGESVDAGANIDAVTYVPLERGMVTVKSQKASFDKIPFGVRDATSLEVEFDFTDLQANLKEMLKKPFYDHTAEGIACVTTNIFILKSDRGTNGASSYIEFCGGQKATLANQFTLSKNPETGAFETKKCTVEAIDIMKLILEQTSTQAWADYILANPTDTYLKAVARNSRLCDWALGVNPYNIKYDYDPGTKEVGGTISPVANLYVGAYLFTYGLKGAIFSALAAWTRNNMAQYVVNIDGTPFEQITYYKQGTSVAHTKGSSVGSANLLVVGKVEYTNGSDGSNVGMLYPDAGGESYLEFPYLWDLLKNLCEGNCCKLTYKPLMIPDGLAVSRLSYSLSYDKIFHNPSNTSIDLSTRFADAHSGDLNFTPCSGVYTSATTELTNQREPDISNFEAQITGTQSDERINAKLIHHNLPTSNIEANRQMKEPRIHLRKLYYLDGSYPIKVHESVTIDDNVTSTLYDNVLALPALAATSGNYESEARVQECTDWAIATPLQNGLPYAVANFYLSRFSDATQNEIPVTMFMRDEETMPENCGDICTIPAIDGFDSSTSAVMLEMDCNWQRGTVDITFFTRGYRMPIIQTPSKSIDRKSQTFTQTGAGGGSFSRQVVQAVDKAVQDKIDLSALETGKDAGNKFAFLFRLIAAVKAELLCKLTPYEVVCHAQDIPTAFSVPDNTLTIIPFTTLVYTPSTGSYSAPTGFTVERDGYYDVDAAFQNYSLTTPVVRVFMNIGTSAGITYQVDDVIMGTEIMRLQGSMKIWCNAGDSIRVYLLHQAGVGILFNTLAHPGATGYVSISYAGSYKAATH